MVTDMGTMNVTDNTQLGRFELAENGQITFANYRREGARLAIRHVEAPPARRGKGSANRLMAGIVAHARTNGLTIIPICSYAVAWFRRHPDTADVLG